MTAVAAVILAALAGVLVWKVTDNAKKDAKKPFTFEKVLVAAKPIPANMTFGDALDAKLIVRDDRVRSELPDSAVSGSVTDAQLKDEYKGMVASHAIASDQEIVQTDFVAQSQIVNGVGGQLRLDQDRNKAQSLMAVTLTLDDQHAVGGFVAPGDSVNVMATLAENQDHWVTSDHVKFTSFMLTGLKVIAVGSTTTAPQSSSSAAPGATTTTVASNRSLITFEVTPRQAEQLVQAETVGSLYLTLNPPDFKPGDFKNTDEIVEAVNLFDKPLSVVDRETPKLPR